MSLRMSEEQFQKHFSGNPVIMEKYKEVFEPETQKTDKKRQGDKRRNVQKKEQSFPWELFSGFVWLAIFILAGLIISLLGLC